MESSGDAVDKSHDQREERTGASNLLNMHGVCAVQCDMRESTLWHKCVERPTRVLYA